MGSQHQTRLIWDNHTILIHPFMYSYHACSENRGLVVPTATTSYRMVDDFLEGEKDNVVIINYNHHYILL